MMTIRRGGARCRLCDSGDVAAVQTEYRDSCAYHVVRCRRCRLYQTVEHHDPISPDYVSLTESDNDAARLWCQGEHKLAAYEQWLELARGRLAPGRRPALLDVGCGTGGFLRFAEQHGFEVFGFDASEAQARHAKRRFPTVSAATSIPSYVAAGAAPRRFAVITLWDVLEHIREPAALLTAVREHLVPHGWAFVSIPSGGAIAWKRAAYRLLGRELSLTPWEHVFYYSPTTLARVLEAAGLRVDQIGSVVCYRRRMSPLEIVRRVGFRVLQRVPRLAPQVYAWAQAPA